MAAGEGFWRSHTETCRLPFQGLVNPPPKWGVLTDTGTSSGSFYDMRFFDPATLYNRSVIIDGALGTAPEQLCIYGTVQFVLKGDRGDKLVIRLDGMRYNPIGNTNLLAPTRLHAYGLATVVSPDKTQSGLWYDYNTPTARKFTTFIEHNRVPYLCPCAIGVSAIARPLAMWSNLKAQFQHIWAVSYGPATVYVVCRGIAALLLACGGPAVGAPVVAICIFFGVFCVVSLHAVYVVYSATHSAPPAQNTVIP